MEKLIMLIGVAVIGFFSLRRKYDASTSRIIVLFGAVVSYFILK